MTTFAGFKGLCSGHTVMSTPSRGQAGHVVGAREMAPTIFVMLLRPGGPGQALTTPGYLFPLHKFPPGQDRCSFTLS